MLLACWHTIITLAYIKLADWFNYLAFDPLSS